MKKPSISGLTFFTLCLAWLASPAGSLLAVPRVQRTILPNGLVLLVSEEHSLPFVTLQILMDSGSRRDPPQGGGLAQLTAKGLLLGTAKRTAPEMNETLDFMGATLNASCGRDYATFKLRVLKKDLDAGLELLMETVTQPTFPEEEVRREIERTRGAIESAEDKPDEVAQKAFWETLFAKGPYGHPVEGTVESLSGITREEIVAFHTTYYHPNNAIMVIAGDVTVDEIEARILPRLGGWARGEAPQEPFKDSWEKGQRTIKIDRAITQAHVIIGHIGVSRENPDYYALTVMNYILGGGGFSSRLVEEIRNKRGLAYAVASFFEPAKYQGPFEIVLQTKNSSAREAISLALDQVGRMREEPVSEKELEGAKKYLVGSFPMRFDTQAKLANFLAQVEYFGLGLDYPARYPSLIGSITAEEVLRVARAYLHPEDRILVVVANLKEAGMDDR